MRLFTQETTMITGETAYPTTRKADRKEVFVPSINIVLAGNLFPTSEDMDNQY